MGESVDTLKSLLKLLAECQFSWFTSVRPDGRPHSVPIWHVLVDGKAYLATSLKSVKVTNIRAHPDVLLAARLEDPLAALMLEGTAALRPDLRAKISPLFEAKYEWNIADDKEYDALIEIDPVRLVAWGQYGEGRWSGEEVKKAAME